MNVTSTATQMQGRCTMMEGNDTEAAEATAAYTAFRESSRFWVQRILVPVIVVVGVAGNLATIIVLSRRRMRSSTNTYLCALAISDLLYLVLIFSLSLRHYPGMTSTEHIAFWYYLPFGHWLTDTFSNTSIWLTVSFTVERYIAVCHPLRGRVMCTETRARKATLIVFLVCLLSTVSTPYEYTVTVKGDEVAMEFSPMGNNDFYRKAFYWFTSIMFILLPLALLAVFNSFLVLAVHRSQRQRRRMTQVEQSDNNQHQENRITITLIAVVILFMICQTPTAVTLIVTSIYEFAGTPEDILIQGLGNIFNFLMCINAACNFLLYCALSDKYRRTFMLTFFPRCYRARSHSTASATSSVTNYTSVQLLTPRGYSMREANGQHQPLTTSLKRHASSYIPRNNNEISL